MKVIVFILILAGLAYGGKYLYDNGYITEYIDGFMSSFDNTVQRTADFATDKAVKEADF